MWDNNYCLPPIRCYDKDEFRQKFTDFPTELEMNTDITLLKVLEKPTTSGLRRERMKVNSVP